MPKIHIGTSGWSYNHWEGIVYPAGTPNRDRLAWFTKMFDTVEINATFYHWPKDIVFDGWRERLPDGFTLTVKAPKSLTHYDKLEHPETWYERVSGAMARLGGRRGVLLAQLPPSLERDLPLLERFLAIYTSGQRVSVEFRHESWHVDPVFEMMEQYGAAYCIMSGARLPCILRATADFVYVRLHGPDAKALYAGSYSDDDMRWWVQRIHEWISQGRDVYAYFNNDWHGHAVRNAEALRLFAG